MVLLRPVWSARALKQGGEPWLKLVPTFGVTFLHRVGCRQPSCGRALGQAVPSGFSRSGPSCVRLLCDAHNSILTGLK